MTLRLGIEPAPHWWEVSALTTAPSLLPRCRHPIFSGKWLRTAVRLAPTQSWLQLFIKKLLSTWLKKNTLFPNKWPLLSPECLSVKKSKSLHTSLKYPRHTLLWPPLLLRDEKNAWQKVSSSVELSRENDLNNRSILSNAVKRWCWTMLTAGIANGFIDHRHLIRQSFTGGLVFSQRLFLWIRMWISR